MKRLPVLLSFIALLALTASITYWVVQWSAPPQRPQAAVLASAAPAPSIDAAATLFGGQAATAAASNYQLTGVVAAGRDSVAILVADGAAPQALKLGKEVTPGVTVREVHPRYVMLSDGGVLKRVDIAQDSRPAGGVPASPLPNQPQFQPQPQAPPQAQPQPQPPPPPAPVQMAPPMRGQVPGAGPQLQ